MDDQILSVNVGDRFSSIVKSTVYEVVRVWFEFSLVDQRWETSVTWDVKPRNGSSYRLSDKARQFVMRLKEDGYIRDGVVLPESKKEVTSGPLAGAPLPSAPKAGTNSTLSTDPKRQQWREDFIKNASRYGLLPTDLDRRIRLGSTRPRSFTIIGCKPRNWKMPILVQGKRGGIYKITAEKAKAGL